MENTSPKFNHKQRKALALDFRAQGLTNAEIARRLDISPGGVTRLFNRAGQEDNQNDIAGHNITSDMSLVRDILKHHLLTAQQLADKIGVSRVTVEYWLSGHRNISEEHRGKLKDLA